MANSLRSELDRRRLVASTIWTLFQARPMVWLHWSRFSKLAPCAWRTRISDARKEAEKIGGVIEWNRNQKRSAYRFLPYVPVARDASIPSPDQWPVFDAPTQETWSLKP